MQPETTLSILLVIGAITVALLILRRQDYKLLAEYVTAQNNNIPLKDAIEHAGKNVPQPVVQSLLAIANTALVLAGGNPELVKAIEGLKQFIVDTTDGLPNTTITPGTAPAPTTITITPPTASPTIYQVSVGDPPGAFTSTGGPTPPADPAPTPVPNP